VFERLGCPTFFAEAVEVVIGRIVSRANSCGLAEE
jgi:hypothetical protein